MALAVNNNTSAFNVFTSYSTNIDNMKRSMARLSSGQQSVYDTPAGVGISERMRSQIRSTAKARNNVDNGISMLQTADSWMQKINDMLARMHELSIEAQDGTKTNDDVDNLQTEFTELQNEIERITSNYSAAAQFNGLYLFRGGSGRAAGGATDAVETGSVNIQVGAEIDQTVGLSLSQLDTGASATIGSVVTYDSSGNLDTDEQISWMSIIDSTQLASVDNSNAGGMITVAIDHLSNERATLGAQQNRLTNTREALLTYEDNLRSAESKIRDVDMASESTEFTRYQILTQISNAMLAQANQMPSAAIQLLG